MTVKRMYIYSVNYINEIDWDDFNMDSPNKFHVNYSVHSTKQFNGFINLKKQKQLPPEFISSSFPIISQIGILNISKLPQKLTSTFLYKRMLKL